MTRFAPLWQQAGSYPAQLDRGLIAALWPGGGVVGGAVTAVNNTMTVSVAPGTAAVPLQSGQGAALCRWDAPEVVTIGAAPGSGTSRIDLIVAQVRDNAIDAGPNNDFVVVAVAGTAAATPTAPAVPANALALYQITVPGTVANLNTAPLADRRGIHTEVYQTNGQSLPNTTFTKIDYDSVSSGYGYDRTLGYLCPIAGRYSVNAAMLISGTPAFVGLSLYNNGTEAKRASTVSTSGTNNPLAPLAVTLQCAAGDRLLVYGLVGPAANTFPGSAFSWAHFAYVAPQ